MLADVNYIGPLAGVFTFSGDVVVGADCNGFRPMCVTQFSSNEEEFLQFSSEWLRNDDPHARYTVVHPGQVRWHSLTAIFYVVIFFYIFDVERSSIFPHSPFH